MEFINSAIYFLESKDPLAITTIIFLGLVLGSLANVLIYRLPIMEDLSIIGYGETICEKMKKDVEVFLNKNKGFNLSFPASTCPNCGSRIRWWNNIPIISYLFLMGKSSCCGYKIPLYYFLSELIISIGFLISYLYFSLSDFLLVAFFIYLSYLIIVIDYKSMYIPLTFSVAFVYFGYIYNMYSSVPLISIENSVLSSIIIYISLFTFVYFYKLIAKKEVMGGADLIIYAGVGSMFGLQTSVYIILLSTIIGMLHVLLIKIKLKLQNADFYIERIPFAPSIIYSYVIFYLLAHYYSADFY